MSLQDFSDGMRIVDANRSRSFFAGPRDPALIAAAEVAIGGIFPPTYREFVQQLGAGSFGAFEFYGVIDANFEKGPIPDGIWLTLKQRRSGKLPENLLVIGDTGDGALYCVELRDGQEGPIITYQPGNSKQSQLSRVVARDFGEFFLAMIREQL